MHYGSFDATKSIFWVWTRIKHSIRFLFLHTPKCAHTSREQTTSIWMPTNANSKTIEVTSQIFTGNLSKSILMISNLSYITANGPKYSFHTLVFKSQTGKNANECITSQWLQLYDHNICGPSTQICYVRSIVDITSGLWRHKTPQIAILSLFRQWNGL